LSPIFACYFDRKEQISVVTKEVAAGLPILEAEGDEGERVRMWKISGQAQIDAIQNTFKNKSLYIADGHHRYETSLAYKWRMLERHRDKTEAPWNRALIYLSDFNSSGLLIRPYHRAIKHLKGMNTEEFLLAIDRLFHKTKLEINPWRDGEEALEKAGDALTEASHKGPAYTLIAADDDDVYLLVPRAESMQLLDDVPEALRPLDVTVLHRLAFGEILEISETDLRAGKVILYDPDWRVIWKAVRKQGWAAAFFLSPVRPEQVSDVAEAGLIMPQKSTYFYPKIPSGLVFHRFR